MIGVGPTETRVRLPDPEKLEFRIVTNTTTAANLLLAGDLDVATISGPDWHG